VALVTKIRFPPGGVTLQSAELNFAFTVVFAERDKVHVPVPEQPPPDQPANFELAFGTAVKVMDVPPPKDALQVAPQLMPAGLLVTVPLPLPDLVTVSVFVVAHAARLICVG